MKQAPELDKLKKQVEMTVTGEGLRIELVEARGAHSMKAGAQSPLVRARRCRR